jgi:hypothetical protein
MNVLRRDWRRKFVKGKFTSKQFTDGETDGGGAVFLPLSAQRAFFNLETKYALESSDLENGHLGNQRTLM